MAIAVDTPIETNVFFSIFAVLGVIATIVLAAVTKNYSLMKKYDLIRKKRQKEVKAAIDDLEQRVSGFKGDHITRLTALEIRDGIRQGRFTAMEVLKAFQQRAVKMHRQVNCLVEPVKEAEADAAAVDAGKKEGLLAGLPISIKDNVGIKNYSSTTGAVKHLLDTSRIDAALIQILRRHGAVIFARSNQPQLGLSVESSNPIYGQVLNPHDHKRTPGGSSSGEGALVGSGASVLGLGSDIGGSVRTPATWSGCCTIKATAERISHLGMEDLISVGDSCIKVTWGPMTRDIDSLTLMMRALWDGSMHDIDPISPPVTFNEQVFSSTKPLKIAYYYDNGDFAPAPVCRRAVDMAIKELKQQGHQLFEWCPPGAATAHLLEYQVLFCDAGEEILELMKNDRIDPCFQGVYDVLKLPKAAKLARAQMLKNKDANTAALLEASCGTGSVSGYFKLEGKVLKYRRKVLTEMKQKGIDAIICPPTAFPALPFGNSLLSVTGCWYNMIYNVLNFPSGVVRMTKQSQEDIKALDDYEIRDDRHAKVRELIKDGEGLPCGVMVTAATWNDEQVLRVMKELEKAADYVIS